jgi:hypothetical protein
MKFITDLLPEALRPFGSVVLVGAMAAIGLIVILVLLKKLRGSKKYDPDAGLDVNLSEFPAPPKPGAYRLLFEGQPVRIRLVVLAPSGRGSKITADMAEGLLESVLPGLGAVAQADKPRISIWPSQLSVAGFAPTFFRHVHVMGKMNPWVRIAGPAKTAPATVCLGLGLLFAESQHAGTRVMTEAKWPELLRIQTGR